MDNFSDDPIDSRLSAADPARLSQSASGLDAAATDPGTSPLRAWWMTTSSRSRRSLGAGVAGVAAVGVVLAGTYAAPNQALIQLADSSARSSTQASGLSYGEADSKMMMPLMDINFVPGDKLSTEPGRGHVYRLELAADLESVARTAANYFGVEGEYAEASYFDAEWPTFVIGSDDGTTPSIMMTEYGQGSWYYSNPAAYPELECLTEKKVGKGSDAYIECTEYEEAESGKNPDESETRARAEAFFDALGIVYLDDDIVIHVDEWSSIATVALRVNGHSTALESSIAWSGNGEISWATGNAVSPVDMGEFSTVSAVDAVARLEDWRWYGTPPTNYTNQLVSPMSRAVADDLAVSSGTASESGSSEGGEPVVEPTEESTEEPTPAATEEPSEPTPGETTAPIDPTPITPTLPEEPPLEEQTVVIDSAEETLLLVWDESGTAWLVPGMSLNGPMWWPQSVITVVEGVIELPEPIDVMPID